MKKKKFYNGSSMRSHDYSTCGMQYAQLQIK